MKNSRVLKRLLSLICVAVMVFAVMPTALAADKTASNTVASWVSCSAYRCYGADFDINPSIAPKTFNIRNAINPKVTATSGYAYIYEVKFRMDYDYVDNGTSGVALNKFAFGKDQISKIFYDDYAEYTYHVYAIAGEGATFGFFYYYNGDFYRNTITF